MNHPVAEVIIPTFAHPFLLPHSLASVRRQSVENIVIHVVGDGTCDATRSMVAASMKIDDRIIFHDHPKSARTGEEYRHPIVAASKAEFVTYLGDDDLMAPDHVQSMHEVLQSTDVAFPPHTRVNCDGEMIVETYSLEEEYWREVALAGTALFSLTGMAHTTTYYRSLSRGWESTPTGYHTDQFMILKFIQHDGTRFALTPYPTVMHFPSTERRHMSADHRASELAEFARRYATLDDWTAQRESFVRIIRRTSDQRHRHLILLARDHENVHAALQHQVRESTALQESLNRIESARIIKLRNRLLQFRAVRRLVRMRS